MKLPPRYDWHRDPNNWKVLDKNKSLHIPPNRCFYCGSRFLDSTYAAYCNVCDEAMSPDTDELRFVVTAYDPNAKPPLKEGYWTTRRDLIKNRIRIPEGIAEKDYKKKMDDIARLSNPDRVSFKPDFKNATDLV